MILGYSRMRYAVFTLSTDTSTLIQCHLNAFEYFGGYTEEILYDNIKTVILKRALRAGDHQWNPKFEDFFSHHGFIPRLCKPYCPQTKGKIENTIGYVKRDFLLGGTFSSLDDLNRQLLQWCNRVNAEPHGTTHEIPVERLQQENLKPLIGIPPYRLRQEEHRKISREAYISYLGNRYSVPYRFRRERGDSGDPARSDDRQGRHRDHLLAYHRSRACPDHPGEGTLLRPSCRGHAL